MGQISLHFKLKTGIGPLGEIPVTLNVEKNSRAGLIGGCDILVGH